MSKSNDGALPLCPIDDWARVLGIHPAGLLQPEDNEVTADSLLLECDSLGIKVPLRISMQEVLRIRSRKVPSIDSGKILFDESPLAITHVGQE